MKLILVQVKFGMQRPQEGDPFEEELGEDNDYNCFYTQNPADKICIGALTMLENTPNLAVLKSIQDHPSLEVRESATQRFLENTDTVRAILMMSGIIMRIRRFIANASRPH